MQISFISLKLKNFKSHRDLEVSFGDVTKISGDNAKGKTSIFESISWVLYNSDTLGSKLDPTPIGYEYNEVKVELLLSVDGKKILLGRGIEKGKNTFYINEVPSKATEFDELVKSLFDKDLFLSLFNPSYFFTLHWEKQRSMLLQYVTPPANKEVLKHLPNLQADKLAELVKKHSIDDLEKIHRDRKNRLEKEHIAAQSRTKTLQEQLDRLPQIDVDIEKARTESSTLLQQIKDIEKATDNADANNSKILDLQSKIRSLREQRDRMKQQFQTLQNEPIADTCRVCKQPLQGDAVEAAKADKQRRIAEFKAEYDDVVAKRKELEAELAILEYIDVSEQIQKMRELEKKRDALEDLLYAHKNRELFQKDVEQAKQDEAATLENLRESIFIIDSVKEFRAKEAELQAQKVQDLFTTLSIRLFEQQKNGELKNTFEIEMNGKPYRKLSLSESIRAGLELRDVLSQQSGIVTPVFIDNAESITRFKQPIGQLIVSRVVAGQELKIETEAVNH
jgi:DNA repair exonuclease SbcCD ATPase subunit